MMKTCLQLLHDGKSNYLDYGRIYNKRVANQYSEFIVKYKRSIAGDFVISNAKEFIEKLRNVVIFRTNEVDNYCYFVFKRALYSMLLNRNFGKVNDMVPEDEDDDNNCEMAPPELLFQIPFPKDVDELEVFLEENSSLILTNHTCILYPCSCDIFTFMMFSKRERGHAIFVIIERNSF